MNHLAFPHLACDDAARSLGAWKRAEVVERLRHGLDNRKKAADLDLQRFDSVGRGEKIRTSAPLDPVQIIRRA